MPDLMVPVVQQNEKNAQSKPPTRCFLSGCYDLFHLGHINALRQVKQYAEFNNAETGAKTHVVAGVHSNAEIRRAKGGAFLNTEQEKERLLLASRFVDEVMHDIPYDTITAHKFGVDHVFHGDDPVKNADGVGLFDEAIDDGTYREIKRTEGVSTTLLIDRFFKKEKKLAELKEKQQAKAAENLPFFKRIFAQTENTMNNLLAECTSRDALLRTIQPPVDEDFQKYGATSTNVSAHRIAMFGPQSFKSKDNKTVVYIQGHFDLLHVGYVDLLDEVVRIAKQHDPAKEVFLILGLLEENDTTPCVQPMMERALTMLSLKAVDDLVFHVQNNQNDNFRRALQIDLIFGVEKHEDFCDADGALLRKPGEVFDHVIDGSKVLTCSRGDILRRFEESRAILQDRQKKKMEGQKVCDRESQKVNDTSVARISSKVTE